MQTSHSVRGAHWELPCSEAAIRAYDAFCQIEVTCRTDCGVSTKRGWQPSRAHSKASATYRRVLLCSAQFLAGVEKVDFCVAFVDGWTAPIALIPLRREVVSNSAREISRDFRRRRQEE